MLRRLQQDARSECLPCLLFKEAHERFAQEVNESCFLYSSIQISAAWVPAYAARQCNVISKELDVVI